MMEVEITQSMQQQAACWTAEVHLPVGAKYLFYSKSSIQALLVTQSKLQWQTSAVSRG
jgi:hypothetical protein